MSIVPTSEVDIANFKQVAQFPPELVNWNERLVKIPLAIRNNFGNGIKIAVLDTGVEKTHLDLAKNLVYSKDFTNEPGANLDIVGHGTEMASLIAASPFTDGMGVMGVAPDATLYSAKVVYDQNNPDDFLSVQNGLDDVLNNQVDIVNMSIGHPPFVPVTPIIQNIMDSISQDTQTLFFAATKEYDDVVAAPDLVQMFPVSCANVVPVCCLTNELVDQYWDTLPVPIVIVPDFNAWCCSIVYRKYYFQDAGSSISTALVSGIAALLLSSDSTIQRTKDGIIAELQKYSSTVEEAFSNPGAELHIIVKIN
ncbi:MAG TPA: S8 family serine peptidase [Mucilaginibacter sp.]|nr:S8 family serine peptidase [Mucilaginibacter sp.]